MAPSNPIALPCHVPLSPGDARIASAACLYCHDAPCTRACPTAIDVPRFIRQIRDEDARGAATTILDANPLGRSCAQVCPTEVLCEGACVANTHLSAPIPIGRLQRFACDTVDQQHITIHTAGPETGKRVAIIGGGPAGLSCGYVLRRHGHSVTIFEAGPGGGGLNRTGVAAWKWTPQEAEAEVERILSLGIELRTNHRIDPSQLPPLLEQYDAVFLGIGLGATGGLPLEGLPHPAVQEALTFIARTRAREVSLSGQQVVVIGAGNTALDAANAGVRCGAARVTLAYRRGPDEMPGFLHEYQLARRSGVQFEWHRQPVAIETEGDRLVSVRLDATQTGEHLRLPCDLLLTALGQVAHDGWSNVPGLECDASGRIVADADLRTSLPGLFAGGDCRNEAREEVVYAAEDGKRAAAAIHARLCGT